MKEPLSPLANGLRDHLPSHGLDTVQTVSLRMTLVTAHLLGQINQTLYYTNPFSSDCQIYKTRPKLPLRLVLFFRLLLILQETTGIYKTTHPYLP